MTTTASPPAPVSAVNIRGSEAYLGSLQDLAEALGCPRAGLLRAGLELAAHRVIEQAPGTAAASAAQEFLRHSRAMASRPMWAASLGLELRTLGQPIGGV